MPDNLKVQVKWNTVPLGGMKRHTDTVVAVVQLPCRVQLFAPHELQHPQASLSFPISWSLPKLTSIELVMPSNHLILCLPLFLLPSIFPSKRVLSSEVALLIRWPKYWSFSFSISPSSEYSGLISFKNHWFDLLTVQGTLESLLPLFESISSLVLSLFCGPTLTSVDQTSDN